jgi:predicted nucleotidyltransferase
MIVRKMRTTHADARRRSPLASALFGKSMQAILARLYGRPDEAFYLRELARLTGTTASSLQRELAALTRAGVIERTVRGQQVYFRANRACPVFDELRGLVVKTFGIADVLKDALQPLADRIDAAFVYGSVARGEERAESDIDLFVVGSVSSGDVVEALVPARQRLGREINPTVFPRAEFSAKARERDHFLTTVLGERKLFLIGGDDELEDLARPRRAAGAQSVKKGNRWPARARRSKSR